MWEIFIQNLPTVIIVIFAVIICGAELIKASRVWKEEHKKKVDKAIEEKQEEANAQNEFISIHEKLDEILNRLGTAEKKLQDLTVSDMHDIKAWIVEQYKIYYVEQGWIDAFHAETIDRRYDDYKKEGGNSYIHTLIERLHTLPMDPPENKNNKKNE